MMALWAFLRRDWWTQASYRFALVETVLSVGFAAALYYFLGQLMLGAPEIQSLQGGYVGFVIVGLALTSFFNAAIFQLAAVFRTEQAMGTLDALLATPIGLPTVLVGSGAWTYALVMIEVLTYLGLALILGVDLSAANWLAGGLIAVLSSGCFASIGVMEASIGIIIKRGNPLAWVLGTLSALIGGAYFPPSLLPQWLQWVSAVHPLSYATRGVRAALLNGASFGQVAPDLIVLLSFDVVLIPASLYFFHRAVRIVRIDGSLTHV